MKRKSKFFSKLCMLLIGLLGFASCSSDDDGEEVEKAVMYGGPYATFEVKGKVTDSQGNPVEGATMRVTMHKYPSGYCSIDKSTTDVEGSFTLVSKYGHPFDSVKVVCLPQGDKLQADSTAIGLKYTGGKGWYTGDASAEVNFKLKDKED